MCTVQVHRCLFCSFSHSYLFNTFWWFVSGFLLQYGGCWAGRGMDREHGLGGRNLRARLAAEPPEQGSAGPPETPCGTPTWRDPAGPPGEILRNPPERPCGTPPKETLRDPPGETLSDSPSKRPSERPCRIPPACARGGPFPSRPFSVPPARPQPRRSPGLTPRLNPL